MGVPWAELELLIANTQQQLIELRNLQSQQASREQEAFWFTTLHDDLLAITNPTTGLRALMVAMREDLTFARADILGAITTARDHIELAIGDPVQAITPPTWWVEPPTPPYVPDESTIAAAVWDWQSAIYYLDGTNYNLSMMQAVEVNASRGLIEQAYYGVPLPQCPFYALAVGRTDAYGPSGWSWPSLSMAWKPAWPDWTAVLATDTAYTFLARTQPTYNWTLTGPGGFNDGHTAWKDIGSGGGTHPWVRSNFTELDMRQLAQLTPTPPTPPTVVTAPVWPGLANVTLGSAHTLSDGLLIDHPMDGLLIIISSHPSWAGKYAFGEVNSWIHTGSVIFGNDDGEYEYPQQIGLDSHLLTPKLMARAASAIVRLNSGFGGTATPWTANA
jgi:hypothetical protein